MAPGGGAQAFASNTLASLLSVQEQSSTSGASSSSDPIDDLIKSADSDGDGSLSLDEIKTSLGDAATDELSAAVSALDTDGDGKLSSKELAAGMEAKRSEHAENHRHVRPSSDDLAAKLIGDVDGDKDGALSLDEVNSALSGKTTDSKGVAEAFGKLDSDADGKLSTSELSAALTAFQSAHSRQGQSQSSVSA
jgi:Ca2+-binding EF-hand superfamily protein